MTKYVIQCYGEQMKVLKDLATCIHRIKYFYYYRFKGDSNNEMCRKDDESDCYTTLNLAKKQQQYCDKKKRAALKNK